MTQKTPQVRGIYAILKKHDIESFIRFNKNEFESILIKFGLQNHWSNIRDREFTSISIMHPFTGNRNSLDNSIMSLLNIAIRQSWFLNFLDDLMIAFINNKKIKNFKYEKFKQTLIHCSFDEMEIDRMLIWEPIEIVNENNNDLKNNLENSTVGTMGHLEKSLIHKIYEEIIANPTRYHKASRSIAVQRKKTVKKRDKFICQICNEEFEEEELEVDHILPYGAGGSNEEYNLMALCRECNANKSAKLDYYRSDEGKLKLMENIKEFVKTLPLIHDFGDWLGNKNRRK